MYIPFMDALGGEGATGELGGRERRQVQIPVLSYVTSGRAQRPTPWYGMDPMEYIIMAWDG